MSSHSLEARCPISVSRVQSEGVWASSGGSKDDLSLAPPSSGGCQHALVVVKSSNPCLCYKIAFSLLFSVQWNPPLPLILKIHLEIEFRSHPDNPEKSHLKFLTLILSVTSFSLSLSLISNCLQVPEIRT